jgi:hypothetical protein
VFHVYQHESHRVVLEELVRFFACGRVRSKGPGSSVLSFSVSSLRQLEILVLPFFERYPLVIKQADFQRFASVVRLMRRKEHLTSSGFERVVRLAFAMNANGKQRTRTLEQVLAGSSETARQAPLLHGEEPAKIQSDLHGDMQSQAEMTWPA